MEAVTPGIEITSFVMDDILASDPGEDLLARRMSRQADIIPFKEDFRVAIIGVGGIGSNAAHLLASMGIRHITLIDPDEVGEENVFPGFFPLGDGFTGPLKATVVDDYLTENFGTMVDSYVLYGEDYQFDDSEMYDVVITGVDSLAARRDIWPVWRDHCRYWIDGRMGGPSCSVYTVDMGDPFTVEAYAQTLLGLGAPLPCGQKATAPLTKGMIPGFIGQSVYDILRGVKPYYKQWYRLSDRLYLKIEEAS